MQPMSRTPLKSIRISMFLLAGTGLVPSPNGYCQDGDKRSGPGGTPGVRLQEAADVFEQFAQASDKGIPRNLLRRSLCVGIIPGMKSGAFIVGGNYGRGYVVCRVEGARWSAPAAIRIEGGSIGFQIGASNTDLMFLVLNRHGKESLLKDKLTLGSEAGDRK